MIPLLSPLEARVLGVLIEKERTVPDTYPLSLNALLTGCNQKSSRDPVMNATVAEVQAALDGLRGMNLAIEASGGRVARYAHNLERLLKVDAAEGAVLAALLLRGAQTSGEVRTGAERLHRFADLAAVEATLEALVVRESGALVEKLPRRPGEREARWMHLLSGPPGEAVAPAETAPVAALEEAVSAGELAALRSSVRRLEAEVGALRHTLERVCAELGIAS